MGGWTCLRARITNTHTRDPVKICARGTWPRRSIHAHALLDWLLALRWGCFCRCFFAGGADGGASGAAVVRARIGSAGRALRGSGVEQTSGATSGLEVASSGVVPSASNATDVSSSASAIGVSVGGGVGASELRKLSASDGRRASGGLLGGGGMSLGKTGGAPRAGSGGGAGTGEVGGVHLLGWAGGGLGGGGTELGSVRAGGSCRGRGWWRKVSVRRRLKLEM